MTHPIFSPGDNVAHEFVKSTFYGNNCRQMAIRFCFTSSVSIRVTRRAHNFRYSQSAITACNQWRETAILFAIACWETRRFSSIILWSSENAALKLTRLKLENVIFASILAPYLTDLCTKEETRQQSVVFISVLPWNLISRLGKVINTNSCFPSNQAEKLVSLLNRYLAWIIVINRTYRKATYEYKEITNYWKYDASCTLTSLPVFGVRKFL
jgi:endonuclease/exonuclease/phosphatase (EEP) superfamily protein YafD